MEHSHILIMPLMCPSNNKFPGTLDYAVHISTPLSGSCSEVSSFQGVEIDHKERTHTSIGSLQLTSRTPTQSLKSHVTASKVVIYQSKTQI